jgi:hypothetical protein
MEDFFMKLNAPKNVTFFIGVALLVVGFIGCLGSFGDFTTLYGPIITFAGGALLALGCLLKGL